MSAEQVFWIRVFGGVICFGGLLLIWAMFSSLSIIGSVVGSMRGKDPPDSAPYG